MKSILKTLKIIYSLLNIGVPVWTAIYIGSHPSTAPLEMGFLAASFYIVAIFIMFMQIPLYKYLPNTLIGMFSILIGPYLLLLISALWTPLAISLYLTEIGAIYTISMMIAFTILVFFGPLMNTTKEAFRDVMLIGLAQLLFIIPGIGASYLFIKFILTQELLHDPHQIILTVLFVITLLENTLVIGRQLKKESIYP